jgi:hypothetical protein
VNPICSVASLRRHNPDSRLLANRAGCCQFHSALFSQVHNATPYLRDILLMRYILVKQNLLEFLDNIFLIDILFQSWGWLRLSKKDINVHAVPINGFPEKELLENRKSAPNAKVRTGISRVSIKSRSSLDLLKGLAEGQGVEPTVCKHRSEFCRLLAARSNAPPLNGHGSRSRTSLSEVQARRPGPLEHFSYFCRAVKGSLNQAIASSAVRSGSSSVMA